MKRSAVDRGPGRTHRRRRLVGSFRGRNWAHWAECWAQTQNRQNLLFFGLLSTDRTNPLEEFTFSSLEVKKKAQRMMTSNLGCVVVAVDGSEESMNALRWALDNLKLRSPADSPSPSSFVVLHVQSPPSIVAGLNPGAIPFGGPSKYSLSSRCRLLLCPLFFFFCYFSEFNWLICH